MPCDPPRREGTIRPPMTPEDSHVRISIGSRFENIDLIQVVVDDALARLGLDEDGRHWVGIAVREGVANAIKHGNRQDPAKEVDVELAIEGREAVIRIADYGSGFDPDEVGDPRTPENLLKPNGRGIFYMRKFVDDIQYSTRPQGGTVVTLRKRLAGPHPGAGSAAKRNGKMKIEARHVQGVTVLAPKGKITIGVGDVALREAVSEALEAGAKNLLLDLGGVSTIDSSGIGELVSAYTTVTNRGGKLKLYNLPSKVTDILQITQLIQVFEIFDDEGSALLSFSGS
jgi:anti-anti-sigma factor